MALHQTFACLSECMSAQCRDRFEPPEEFRRRDSFDYKSRSPPPERFQKAGLPQRSTCRGARENTILSHQEASRPCVRELSTSHHSRTLLSRNGVWGKNTPCTQVLALQSISRNCSPAPDLVPWNLILLCVFVSGGFLFSQTPISESNTV